MMRMNIETDVENQSTVRVYAIVMVRRRITAVNIVKSFMKAHGRERNETKLVYSRNWLSVVVYMYISVPYMVCTSVHFFFKSPAIE